MHQTIVQLLTKHDLFSKLAILILLCFFCSYSQALSFYVDDTGNLPDADLSDGECSTSMSTCTLRAASEQLNYCSEISNETCNLQERDPDWLIELGAGTYQLTNEIVFEASHLTDNGLIVRGAGSEGTIIDASAVDSALTFVFVWETAGNRFRYTLENLTIKDAQETNLSLIGNDIFAPYLKTDASLNDVVLSGAGAAGLYITGVEVTAEESHIESNQGVGIRIEEGGLTLSDSTVNGNMAGGIRHLEGVHPLKINNSEIAYNQNTLSGGGIYIEVCTEEYREEGICSYGGAGGGVEIYDSTLVGNVSTEGSGGALQYDCFNRCNFNVYRSFINENEAPNGSGGGLSISLSGETASKSWFIDQSTIASNRALNGGALSVSNATSAPGDETISRSTLSNNTALLNGGAIYYSKEFVSRAPLTINSTTVAENTGFNGGGIVAGSADQIRLEQSVVALNLGGDCAGTVTDGGSTFDSDSSCGASATGDPALGPLQDNGGPTLTHAPEFGSPLIDGGGLSCDTLDQRDYPAPLDGNGDGTVACDIGSVEISAPSTPAPCNTFSFSNGILVLNFCEFPIIELPILDIDYLDIWLNCLADGPGCWDFPELYSRKALQTLQTQLKYSGIVFCKNTGQWWFRGIQTIDPDKLKLLQKKVIGPSKPIKIDYLSIFNTAKLALID